VITHISILLVNILVITPSAGYLLQCGAVPIGLAALQLEVYCRGRASVKPLDLLLSELNRPGYCLARVHGPPDCDTVIPSLLEARGFAV